MAGIPNRIDMKAHAKVNFRLKVLARLASGYHTLESIMQPIELHDQLALEWVKGKPGIVHFQCSDMKLPQDRDNLAYRAAEMMLGLGRPQHALYLRLVKWIPTGAGLGGGSSDAACVLRGLNTMMGLNLSPQTLMELGAQLGMDVPFFITGQPALVTGCGETVEPFSHFPETWMVLMLPAFSVSTPWAYAALNHGLTRRKRTAKLPRLFRDSRALVPWFRNDLEAPVAAKHPEITRMVQSMLEAGADAAQMSGSGSAVFGLFHDRAHAERVAQTIRPPRSGRVLLTRGLPMPPD